MVESQYANAYKEVLEILKYVQIEDYNKIPKTKISINKPVIPTMNIINNVNVITPSIRLYKGNKCPKINYCFCKLFQTSGKWFTKSPRRMTFLIGDAKDTIIKDCKNNQRNRI